MSQWVRNPDELAQRLRCTRHHRSNQADFGVGLPRRGGRKRMEKKPFVPPDLKEEASLTEVTLVLSVG